MARAARAARPVLLHVVEAAAVHLPELAADAGLGVRRVLRRPERLVEQDEVERRADPRDRRDHVQPAEAEVEPVASRTGRARAAATGTRHPRLQRSSAIATSSPSAVSSSSSVGSLDPARAAPRGSRAFGPPVDEDDEAEAVPRLVARRSGGRARRARPDRRRRPARRRSAPRAPCARRSPGARRAPPASPRRESSCTSDARRARADPSLAASRSTKRVRPSNSSASSLGSQLPR